MSRPAMVALVTVLSACELVPEPRGMTCNDVSQDVCEAAFEYVELVMETRSGETVTSVLVGPTQVSSDCLHDDLPLADVVVRVEGKEDPIEWTFARTLRGEPSICFH